MSPNQPHPDDEKLLRQLGYEQELSRRMSGFSNFAISLSIICILAGGITSFHVGLCSAGGASIGLGWPLVCLFSLCVAATMAQVASAFPTAGGLYHWGSILGGRVAAGRVVRPGAKAIQGAAADRHHRERDMNRPSIPATQITPKGVPHDFVLHDSVSLPRKRQCSWSTESLKRRLCLIS